MSSSSAGEGPNESCLKALQCLYAYKIFNKFDYENIEFPLNLEIFKINTNILKKELNILLLYTTLYLNLYNNNSGQGSKTKCNNPFLINDINKYLIKINQNQIKWIKEKLPDLGVEGKSVSANEFYGEFITYLKKISNYQKQPNITQVNTYTSNLIELIKKKLSSIYNIAEENFNNIHYLINNIFPFAEIQQDLIDIMGQKLNAIGTKNTGAGGGYTGLFEQIHTLINTLHHQGATRETVESYFTRLDALAGQAVEFRKRLGALGEQLTAYQKLVGQITVKDQEIVDLLARLQAPTGGPQGPGHAGGGYISEEKVKKSRGRPVKNVATIKKTSLKKTYKNAIAV